MFWKIGAAMSILILAMPAQAQMVTAKDPESLVRAMRAGGHEANLTTDKVGEPLIQGNASGMKFQVLFYNCTEKKNCATVQFTTGYQLDSDFPLARVNEWNRSKRFGRAYVDEVGDPILQMDLDLDDGGLSQELFIDNLEFWTAVVDEFEEHIGWKD